MSTDDQAINRVADVLRDARHIVALTGAGVSAESGVPTFRDKLTGMWEKYDPTQLATPDAFRADPALVTKWNAWRRRLILDTEPNPAHAALVELETRMLGSGRSFTLITQNIDRLHHRAGSRDPIEVHGNIMEWRCSKTGAIVEPTDEMLERPPVKTEAGGFLRPNVVWFGEALPEDAINRSMDALAACDVFLSIGTSAVVFPAAGFCQVAQQAGATAVEINRDPTPLTSVVDVSIRGSAAEILPALVARVFGRGA
ncbi:MAG: NAD-dependent deacylase [Phycisphaerales bacterium]